MEHSAIPIPPDPQVLARIPANMLEDTIERLIAELDGRSGDSDLEPNGDELDGDNAEDEHLYGSVHGALGLGFDGGPGCPVGDPGDNAYTEWHTRGRQKEPPCGLSLVHEDEEDDDPADGTSAEDEAGYRWRSKGPGCLIADPDRAVDDQACDPESEDGI